MSRRPAGQGSSNGQLQLVEVARGLAALAVVLHHGGRLMAPAQYSGHVGLGNLFDLGLLGVDFFFLLSGFLIPYVHFADIDRPGRLPRYAWRRLVRIFPAYWLMVLVELAARAVFSPEDVGSPSGWLGQAFIALPRDLLWIGPAWSLQFELLFYAFFALLILSGRLGLLCFLAWQGAALIYTVAPFGAGLPWPVSGLLLHGYCLYFPMGMLIGFLARRHPRLLGPSILAYGIAAAAVFFARSGVPPLDFGLARYLFVGGALGAVLALIVWLDLQGARAPAALRLLGGASYSIYLSHVFIIAHVYAVLARLGLYAQIPELLVFVLALAAAIVGGLALHLLFERPVLAGLRRFAK